MSNADERPRDRRPGILDGQKALVTGGNTGIGQGIAVALGQAGADVAVNYIRGSTAARNVVRLIRKAGSQGVAIRADISKEKQVHTLFDRAIEALGSLDIVVNNAGILDDAPIDRMTLTQWNNVISVNLTGQFLCIREAVRAFKRRGTIGGVSASLGTIICISSIHEVIPYGGHANYAASKAGVMQLMKSVAQEVAPYRIRVNSICPGITRSQLSRSVWEESDRYESVMKVLPYGRIGEPEDIGRLAVFLASDQADYITGTSIFIDGGITLYAGARSLVRENLSLRRRMAVLERARAATSV